MLIISLVVSAILLIMVDIIAWKNRFPLLGIIIACGCAFFGQFFIMAAFPALTVQCVCLTVLAIGCRLASSRPSTFIKGSVLLTLTAYLFIWWTLVVPERQRFENLRATYPLQDMSVRVPEPKVISKSAVFFDSNNRRWQETENALDRYDGRRWALETLHERSVQEFINSEGFGVTR